MILRFDGKTPVVPASAFVAPGAAVIGDVVLGEDASVWYGAVVRGDVHWIRIGRGTNIQDGTVIHVTTARWPTEIGEEVTVGHKAVLHGCRVRRSALIGMGAIVLDDAEVGEEAMVAAGALVTPGTRIPPRTLALGVPARVRRDLTEEELRGLKESAHHYVELARAHRERACPIDEP
ncbi:MAG: gamma carbonic anhydrase family protein [Planctomycetes bacterium]|nr:gamma carbonic anhydrase family protein [Planctomycetota bacterium]